jgi:hypothetical protein
MVATATRHRPSPATTDNDVGHIDARFTERDAILARVSLEAHDRYRHTSIPPEVLDRYVTEAVDEIWDDSLRVTAYVPILAMRRIRARIEQLTATNGGSTVGPP